MEQIGQRARTEFDEDDSAPSTSGKSNGTSSSENTRLFGEGRSLSYDLKRACLASIGPRVSLQHDYISPELSHM